VRSANTVSQQHEGVETSHDRDYVRATPQMTSATCGGPGYVHNADVVRRFYEGWNRRSIDFEVLVAVDIVNHQPEVEPEHGRRQFEQAIGRVVAAVRDSKWDIVDLVSDGDRVAVRTIWTGTYGAPQFRGVPIPTPGTFAVEHIHIYRLAGGRLAEHWVVRDDLTMLRQLGVLGREHTIR